ncbi:DUF1364 domain-containing protein [Gayadomonas joobiniege]|uniref:DUF1364 domain-containing protein n=1 Tax=Gayadomonas joobiniege TaxID=1234606 RepID=UPI00037A28FC|nr:DUF1364 domain-containing protein [Gayadomonas joobiniege]
MSLISKKLRASAKYQSCQVRIPSICNHNPETVVLAHIGRDSGIGQKADDLHATFCCSACHDVIDGRVKQSIFTMNEITLFAWEGVQRTQRIWLGLGLIEVAS